MYIGGFGAVTSKTQLVVPIGSVTALEVPVNDTMDADPHEFGITKQSNAPPHSFIIMLAHYHVDIKAYGGIPHFIDCNEYIQSLLHALFFVFNEYNPVSKS